MRLPGLLLLLCSSLRSNLTSVQGRVDLPTWFHYDAGCCTVKSGVGDLVSWTAMLTESDCLMSAGLR